tara:strand:+ start:451 stop:2229 length:1779 start_codon:yes stop_codon:yes gene_type:complete
MDFTKLSKKDITKLYNDACHYYYNTDSPIMTDDEFDNLLEYVKEKYSESTFWKKIGSNVLKDKTKLPFFMGSMNKIKQEKELEIWKKKFSNNNYILSAKLDGISALLDSRGENPQFYTRGNGYEGQNITSLLKHLKLNIIPNTVIRGELIISKDKENSGRNIVAGIVNSKYIEKNQISNIEFIPYEVIYPVLLPNKQMEFLKNNYKNSVLYEIVENIDIKIFQQKLLEWKKNYNYEIDGIICSDNQIYPRINENPKFSFAFKMNLQQVQSKVTNVKWKISKDGYIKPTIHFEPVKIGNIVMEKATGFNASFIQKNNIGQDAIVEIVHSGDVIPYITKVIKNSTICSLPTDIDYYWNDTNVDIIVKNSTNNKEVQLQKIVYFFKNLNVDGLGEKNIQKIFENGFHTIPSFISITKNDLLLIDGFQKKTCEKIFSSIHSQLNNIKLSKLMSISNIFGRGVGEKKFDLIFDTFPDFFKLQDQKQKICSIKGFTSLTANQIVNNIPEFLSFIKEINLQDKLVISKTSKSKYTYAFSGFRNKELEKKLIENGNDIAQTISKNVNILIVKNKNDKSSKIEKAKKLNIQIIDYSDFILI